MKKHRQSSTESTIELTPQQAKEIMAITSGATVTDAAKQAGIDRTTFYLWIRINALFQTELNRAKQEQRDATRAQLPGLVDAAISTLREMLTGSDVPAGVRLKAALCVLQSVGTLEPEPIGKTDAAAIEQERIFGFVELQ